MQVHKIEKLQGVIFDLDGTLADTLNVSFAAFKSALEPLVKRSLSNQEIMATFGPTEEGTVRELAPEYYAKGISDYLHHYERLHHICPKPFVGIPELLLYLKKTKIRTAIVTGKGKISTNISLEYLGIRDFFNLIETGSPVKSIKDESLQYILQIWSDIDKRNVVYVGDTLVDIAAGEEVGICVASAAWSKLTNYVILKERNPNLTFKTVNDFSSWVKTKVDAFDL